MNKEEAPRRPGAIAHIRARGRVRRNLRADCDSAVARDLGRDIADPLHVQVAMRAREAELARKQPPHLISVEQRDRSSRALDERRERLRERRLSGAGKAGQKNHQSAWIR